MLMRDITDIKISCAAAMEPEAGRTFQKEISFLRLTSPGFWLNGWMVGWGGPKDWLQAKCPCTHKSKGSFRTEAG
jgi:hypothetical protein